MICENCQAEVSESHETPEQCLLFLVGDKRITGELWQPRKIIHNTGEGFIEHKDLLQVRWERHPMSPRLAFEYQVSLSIDNLYSLSDAKQLLEFLLFKTRGMRVEANND